MQEGKSELAQIRAGFIFTTANRHEQEMPDKPWQREAEDPFEKSLGTTGSVTDPFQQERNRVGADSSNRLRSLIKLLRGWPSAVISQAPYSTVRAVSAYVQPLRERPAVVNRLVIAAWWLRRDKDYCEDKQKPSKGPEQGLSALPHVRRLAWAPRKGKTRASHSAPST